MFRGLKELWGNLSVFNKWRQKRLKASAAVKPDELDEAYKRIKTLAQGDEALLKDLDKLKATADSGLNITRWVRRFLFGFRIANAIEEWFRAFDQADPKKPLLERIPRQETSNVAAKWAWFGFFGVFISTLFALSIAVVTAVFLYFQYDITREANINAQRTQYTQILYDEECKEGTTRKGFSFDDVEEEKNNSVVTICKPLYNPRIRTEAALAFLKLEREKGDRGDRPDFAYSHLEKTILDEVDLRRVDFFGAVLSEADLTRANLKEAKLNKADLRKANLKEADLSGADLFGANLRRAVLRRVNLGGANLILADLREVDFYGADLFGANLRRANLGGANLSGASLTNADLYRASLHKVRIGDSTKISDKWRLVWEIVNQGAQKQDLSKIDLSGADLFGADLKEANLKEADLSGADLFGADLSGADLSGASLTNADLYGTSLYKVKIDDSTKISDKWRLVWEIVNQGAQKRDLSRADLFGANFSEVNLKEINLSEADLSNSYLIEADLSGAILSRADLFGADLFRAKLFYVDLRWAYLGEADLSESYLIKANLNKAILSGADLFGADLSGADLSGADLEEANLREANLSGVDFTNVRFLTQEQLDTACGDEETKLPRRPKGLMIRPCEK